MENQPLGQEPQNNVQRSIARQPGLIQVMRKVITTPTICSAATSFLQIFSDLATLIMMMQGLEAFKDYVEWLHKLLID